MSILLPGMAHHHARCGLPDSLNDSLAEIYSDLCACCKRNDHAAKDQKKRRAQLAHGAANRYVGLTAEHVEDNDDEEAVAEDTALASCPECTDATPPTCNEAELHFADDGLGTFLEVRAAVQVRETSLHLCSGHNQCSACETYRPRPTTAGT